MRGGDKPSIFQNRATRACGSRVALKEIATVIERAWREGPTLPDRPDMSALYYSDELEPFSKSSAQGVGVRGVAAVLVGR